MADEKIVNFIKELLIQSDLVKRGDEFDENYVNELAGELEKRLGYTALKELSTDGLTEYQKLTADGKNSPEASFELFKRDIPDFDQKMQKTLKEFAVNFMARTAKMREALL